MAPETMRIRLTDGTELNLLAAGAGPVLLMLPGWSQSAAMFKHQLTGLSKSMRVLALDPRGHGASSNASTGYTIDQMAADLREVIEQLELTEITLLGHSLSNTFFWRYGQLYDYDRVQRLVIADQSPILCLDGGVSEADRRQAGAVFTPEQLETTCAMFKAVMTANDGGIQAKNATQSMIQPMFSPRFSATELAWATEENLKLPRNLAADLLHDGSLRDWRSVIPTINVPTLVLGGRKSVVPWESQVWIGEQIPGARSVIFTEAEIGYHFAFLENPDRFNREVRAFCSAATP